jgi:hypothetical protein
VSVREDSGVRFRYTRHQTARGTRPDGEVGDTYHLIKYVSLLRLTYQIRLLTFLAHERGKKLVISLPRYATLDDSLAGFVKQHRKTIRVERM